ncbi:hypothetical protein ILUMI_02877 [Ignelater luminosus]|uniref:Virilizer N-terminal domain-containing protein n=1 Tax=Ignelater luminosus TaxID=2038154 RepID=A0A8K0GMR9_IGNLU|nr:hypothetical protein ILUMI_02877 [Ignelater luminosus]
MTETVDLLFFDTFAHENSEELNLDLVQFPKPVYVTEVRIIPLGARVQADFPGGVRLGATNPSQFSIEFFVNDLGKPGASTFESLGGFDYNQNGCINLECATNDSVRKIPTDGLVLRGWYTTITLAVYGILTSNIAEQIIQPVVPPAIPPQTNPLPEVQQIIPVNTIENEWSQETMQPVPMEYTQQPHPVPYAAQTYAATEQFPQEYTDYYNEPPKDPRSYHNTPESDWDNKSRGRSIERDRDRDSRDRPREVDRYQKTGSLEREHSRVENDRRDRDRDRDRHYSTRSHSQDRDRQSREFRETSRDRERDRERDRDWEHEHAPNFDFREHPEKDWDRDRDRDRDRNYKHQDNYRRTYGRDDREEIRKRPRTPPMNSPKRPHTPHSHTERKELSPVEVESFSEEEFNSEKQRKEWDGQNNNRKNSPKENQETQSPMNEEALHMDVEEFEPILSDEDILDDSEHFQDLDYDYTAYTNNDDLIKLFVPGTTPIQKYKKKPVFNVTDEKIEISESLKSVINISDDFFRSSITKYTLSEFEKLNTEIKEEFIHLCEKIMSTIGETEHFYDIVKLYTLTKDSSTLKDTDKELVTQIGSITETLMDWLQIALDFGMANTQNQPAYKIRHIKCGVRLADWCCGSIEFIQLLWNRNYYIHEVLLSLYNQEYMALSIKLMILHALDTYILHKPAIERFVLGKANISKENGFFDALPFSKQNGYKTLIEIIQENPSVRLKFSLQSILMKLNIYEVLYKLHGTVAKLRHNNNKNISDNINLIVKSLDQILHMYQSGPFIVSQPKRFLPVSAQFEINRMETKNVFINLFQMQNLLNCFIVLLTLPNTMNISSVKTPIFELLSELISTADGLNYLYDNEENINVLLKCLLQQQNDEYSMPYSMETKAHMLGLQIAYKLQAAYHIDCLLDIGEKYKFDCDASEVIDQLHALYCLTFSNIGKISCSNVLSFQNNIKCLLQFLDILNVKEKSDAQLTKIKKSPGIGYIIDLITFTITYNNFNVNLLQNYSKQFLYIINQDLFEPSVTVKINEFAPYVRPFETLTLLNYDNISPIVEMINRHVDSVTSYPGQLITCLRILQHLGISKYAAKTSIYENPLNNYIELKYKHVIIQLYSMDGVAILTKILQKICEHYEQPTLHTTTFVSNQAIYIINTIQPCIDLLKQMLTYVIQCRNTNFKDLTTIPTLLQTYNLLRSFPSSSPVYSTAKKLCEKLIDTLLVYTQPISDEVNEKDSLSKTLWTLMCGEVIKYTNSSPYTFITGLLIFSELLPLPLPIQTREPLTTEEVSWAVNLRKLWSAHLHAYTNNIQELINRMCTSTHPPLLNLLRKVCIQLADLAANSAIMIARGILDTVHTGLTTEEDLNQPCSGNTARLLNLLACLVTHNSLKCAVLHLLYPNNPNISKGDEKYAGLLQTFARIVNVTSNVNSHIQAQECILSIIQSLCDTEITLLQNATSDKTEISQEVYLANSLPTKECLLTFISMITDHLVAENSFVTYLPILRSLMLLTEHDYGFYHLREHLNKKTEPFVNILNKLVENFSKDNEECLSTLNTLTEFLRISMTPEEIAESMNLRTIKMSLGEVKALIGWKQESSEENKIHPLLQLQELLKKTIREDKTFDNYLLEGVTNIINILNKEASESKETYTEPLLPAPGSLLIQFAGRPIFTLSDVADEQLTSAYWLSAPTDEGSGDIENVTCDLSEMCRLHLPSEVNLIREVEKLCRIYPSNNTEQDDSKAKGSDVQKDKNKKTFVTPMARRGFPRAIQARADLFRSRPPNTSRPPSLHVDDFVALETCGAQPTGPTGYNKISRELLATSRVARGTRGRSFITSERAVQYRQMSWWGAGLGRGPYQ